MGANPMTGVLEKRGNLGTETCIQGRQGEETQGGDVHLQSRRARPGTDPTLPALRMNQFYQHLDLGLLTSRTMRQYISVASATQCVVVCYVNPRKQIHHDFFFFF